MYDGRWVSASKVPRVGAMFTPYVSKQRTTSDFNIRQYTRNGFKVLLQLKKLNDEEIPTDSRPGKHYYGKDLKPQKSSNIIRQRAKYHAEPADHGNRVQPCIT